MHWDLTRATMALLLLVAGYCVDYRCGRAHHRADQAAQPNTNISDEDIKTALRGGRKIKAIGLYRQRCGFGLKNTKAALEATGMARVRTMR